MTIQIRILLIVGALLTTGYMLARIRKSKLKIEDSVFWIVFSGCIVLLSVFPQIAFWATWLLGIQSPINTVYLFIIFVLLVRLFSVTSKLSQLENRIDKLAQHVAIREKEEKDS